MSEAGFRNNPQTSSTSQPTPPNFPPPDPPKDYESAQHTKPLDDTKFDEEGYPNPDLSRYDLPKHPPVGGIPTPFVVMGLNKIDPQKPSTSDYEQPKSLLAINDSETGNTQMQQFHIPRPEIDMLKRKEQNIFVTSTSAEVEEKNVRFLEEISSRSYTESSPALPLDISDAPKQMENRRRKKVNKQGFFCFLLMLLFICIGVGAISFLVLIIGRHHDINTDNSTIITTTVNPIL